MVGYTKTKDNKYTTLSPTKTCTEIYQQTTVAWLIASARHIIKVSILNTQTSACEIQHYHSMVKQEQYGGKHLNSPKYFSWVVVPRHTFLDQLLQLCTDHGVLGKYFQTRDISERDLLRKVSSELNPKILLDTKQGLGAVIEFLDSLPQLVCWWFAWLKQLVKGFLLSANLWYRSTGCYASWDFP